MTDTNVNEADPVVEKSNLITRFETRMGVADPPLDNSSIDADTVHTLTHPPLIQITSASVYSLLSTYTVLFTILDIKARTYGQLPCQSLFLPYFRMICIAFCSLVEARMDLLFLPSAEQITNGTYQTSVHQNIFNYKMLLCFCLSDNLPCSSYRWHMTDSS